MCPNGPRAHRAAQPPRRRSRPGGCAGHKLQGAGRHRHHVLVWRSALPAEGGHFQAELWAGRYLDDRQRRIGLSYVGLDPIGVVAFGAEDRDRVFRGGAGAAAGLETILHGAIRDADDLLDRGFQLTRHLTLYGGARFCSLRKNGRTGSR